MGVVLMVWKNGLVRVEGKWELFGGSCLSGWKMGVVWVWGLRHIIIIWQASKGSGVHHINPNFIQLLSQNNFETLTFDPKQVWGVELIKHSS
jgi:glycerol uptake facilitator-like aquaporin